MLEMYFPDFNVPFPCYTLPFKCNKSNCYYFERTTDKYGNCIIRVANEGGHKLESLSQILGITRERVRQLEASALRHLAWTATVRSLTREVRNILASTLGGVYYWPLQPFNIENYRNRTKLSELELIDKAFYLGILNEFIRDEEATFSPVECLHLGKVVSGLICLLCDQKRFCETTPFGSLDPKDYLTVSSFSEIIKTVKQRLGLTTF